MRGNCCETCRNILQKTPMKEFTENNSLIRQDAFSESLQQLLINKKIDEVALGTRFVLFEVLILMF